MHEPLPSMHDTCMVLPSMHDTCMVLPSMHDTCMVLPSMHDTCIEGTPDTVNNNFGSKNSKQLQCTAICNACAVFFFKYFWKYN